MLRREKYAVKLYKNGGENKSGRIGNCRVVCNPRGYVSLGEKSEFKYNFIIKL